MNELTCFLVLVGAITIAICMSYGDRLWIRIQNFWDNLFTFEYEDRRYDNNYTPYFTPNKPKSCALHDYAFLDVVRHKWYVVDGKPKGFRCNLSDVIKATMERPGHTETKLSELMAWERQGYDIVFTSHRRWRCKKCGEIKSVEFYNTPSKADGTVTPIIDLNLFSRKKQTQVIPTFGRREEIPVEKMKKY